MLLRLSKKRSACGIPPRQAPLANHMKHLRTLLPLFLLAASAAFAQDNTTTQFGEKITVNTVLIDAVVTDRSGNQMLGLSKDDFVVTENGVPQTIDSVDYYTNRRLLTDQESNANFKAERVHEARYYVLFFDKTVGGAFFDRLTLARRAAQQFVNERLQPGDQVAVVGHDVRLKVYSDFTNDKKKLGQALQDATAFGRGLAAAKSATTEPSILANVDAGEMMSRSGTTYEALTVLAEALRPIKARKNVVLFSPGIIEPGEDVRNGVVLNKSRYYDPMVEALNAANVAVYPIQLTEDAGTTPALHQTLERVAVDTNGEYFRYATNFVQPLKKIENTTSGYYLISYRTKKPRGVRGFQKVDVKLKNPEFRVQARAGYLYE
jgi:VWFA-related protein